MQILSTCDTFLSTWTSAGDVVLSWWHPWPTVQVYREQGVKVEISHDGEWLTGTTLELIEVRAAVACWCYLRPSSDPPKLNGQSLFFHIEILIWGKCTSFRQTQIPFKWFLQLASQIWRLSQQVGYVLFYATPAGRICPRGWRSWSKPHGMRTSWTWRVWAETIQARFKLYIVIWFNNVL